MSSNSGVVGGTPFTDSSSDTRSTGGASAVDSVESDRKFAALRAQKAAERAKKEHTTPRKPQ